MFPPLEPFATGQLVVAPGMSIYWETAGNPDGIPVVWMHGGPGSGVGAGYRRRFDPTTHLIIGLDQRGCGRSVPLVTDARFAGDIRASLAGNTTQALIADLELLREHLAIDRWMLVGVSWGTTLALAYAQAHPHRVRALALMLVTTTSRHEVEWITEDMGRVFPREWDAFAAAADAAPGERLIDAYYRRITDADPAVRAAAARAWCTWEDVHVSLANGFEASPRFEDADFRLLFATLVIHYWAHAAFLPDGLLAGMPLLAEIPSVLIHGRHDVSSPLDTAWRLHRSWSTSELVVVDDEGHGGDRLIEELEAAVARLAAVSARS